MTGDVWSTPRGLFDKLHAEFRFELDVCASIDNAKCSRFFTSVDDGLKQKWRGRCWMNPPYGREITAWMDKAQQSAREGCTVVALVPSRTNAPWWHEHAMRASEIRFIRKKVPFVGPHRGVPFFGSSIVVFRPGVRARSPKVSSFDQGATE